MDDVIAKHTNRLCKQLAAEGMIENDEIPICSYNLQVFVEKTIAFAMIYTVAALLGYLLEVVVFTLPFASIRKYSGRYHCKTFIGCLIVSVITIMLSVPMVAVFDGNNMLYFILLAVSSTIILFIGSMGDPESDYSIDIQNRIKRFGRLMCLLSVAIALLFFFIDSTQHISLYIGSSVIQVAFYLIIAEIKHKEGFQHEEIVEQSGS